MNSLEINGVSLIGNIASISEKKTSSNGKQFQFFDICQNSKYIDKNGIEHEDKTYFSIRLNEKQIIEYQDIIKKGNWIHITGKITNYTINNNKKYCIIVRNIHEMKKKDMQKEDTDILNYDWLNDSIEEEYEMC